MKKIKLIGLLFALQGLLFPQAAHGDIVSQSGNTVIYGNPIDLGEYTYKSVVDSEEVNGNFVLTERFINGRLMGRFVENTGCTGSVAVWQEGH